MKMNLVAAIFVAFVATAGIAAQTGTCSLKQENETVLFVCTPPPPRCRGPDGALLASEGPFHEMRTGTQKLGAQSKLTQLRENPLFRGTTLRSRNEISYVFDCWFFIVRYKCKYQNGLGNAHQALCSTVL
jgi:hypothetical protein